MESSYLLHQLAEVETQQTCCFWHLQSQCVFYSFDKGISQREEKALHPTWPGNAHKHIGFYGETCMNACKHHTGCRVLTVGVGEEQQGLFHCTLNLLYVVYRFPNALADKVVKPSSEETTWRGRNWRGGKRRRVKPALKTWKEMRFMAREREQERERKKKEDDTICSVTPPDPRHGPQTKQSSMTRSQQTHTDSVQADQAALYRSHFKTAPQLSHKLR